MGLPGALAFQDRAAVAPLADASSRRGWCIDSSFAAEVLVNRRLVASGSSRDVRHIELSLAGSGLCYRPGDALGVWPRQSPQLVAAIIGALRLDAGEPASFSGTTLPLRQWLETRRDLSLLTQSFVRAHARRGGHRDLLALADSPAGIPMLMKHWRLREFLARWPSLWEASALVAALSPLEPRFYSISSSQLVAGDKAHLTVAGANPRHQSQNRKGVAARHLSACHPGDSVRVFVAANGRFRLPADPATDIIMVGAGTGVAPFRAFVQERAASGASGRQWLFFGNPHRQSDFLYQQEWQLHLRQGTLAHLSAAFSRDQQHKIYVQDRLRERGGELWRWLEGGAHIYLCGDAGRMAPAVQTALLEIAVADGGMPPAAATLWLHDLVRSGRFASDVY